MLDVFDTPSMTKADVQLFTATFQSGSTLSWQPWYKPRGISMVYIFGVGAGGGGGDGAAGTITAGAGAGTGGAGGGSGGQTAILMPAVLVPDILYVAVQAGSPNRTSTGAGPATTASYVSVVPGGNSPPPATNILFQVNSGAQGGKSAGTTATAGTAGAISTAAQMPLGFSYVLATPLAGQAGGAGAAVNTTPTAVALPVTGLIVTGGTAGGSLPAANGSPSISGSAITNIVGSFINGGVLATLTGGTPGSATPTAGLTGTNGVRPFKGSLFGLGGIGGGGGGLSAGGTGAAGGNGGSGAPGCGGGGGAGCLTGQQFGLGGRGGDGFIYIISY